MCTGRTGAGFGFERCVCAGHEGIFKAPLLSSHASESENKIMQSSVCVHARAWRGVYAQSDHLDAGPVRECHKH